MRTFVGITDRDWFDFLGNLEGVDEVNFWQPGERAVFKVLQPGDLFLFKLHSPHNFIVGGGWFAHWTRLPVLMAWDAFGQKNGAPSLAEMVRRVERYRRTPSGPWGSYSVGCILLEQPFFLPQSMWIPVPVTWPMQAVQGKSYDATSAEGRELFASVHSALAVLRPGLIADTAIEAPRRGAPTLVYPRLGQGSFRAVVTDAYERRCAMTRERTLPALEAAHIKPWSRSGPHDPANGLLLRRDLHSLYDAGYLTVTPEHRIEVSRRIREEYENGRDYYALHGNEIYVPGKEPWRPAGEMLAWHNEQVFLG